MAPEWWVEAAMAAEEEHDPTLYEGRQWNELTWAEQESAMYEYLYGVADAARDAVKEG